MNRFLAVAAVTLAICPQIATGQSQGTTTLGGRVAVERGNFTGETTASLVMAGKAVGYQGKIAICGAYAIEGRLPNRLRNQVMRDALFYIDDQLVLSNMNFFENAGGPDDLKTDSTARCQLTDRDWNDSLQNADWRFVIKGDHRYRQ